MWAAYIYFTFPDTEKIIKNQKGKYHETTTPDQSTYARLVKEDKKAKRTILLGKATHSVMHDNMFPFSTHEFNLNETERILEVINDSANFNWGEIGTPYYDKIIFFYDEDENEIGYLDISLDGEIKVFPDLALTKWGLLSDKGFQELVLAIRTE
ncbi:MAG: hypothetical protein CFE21_01115 [Bacteroidetes bacterium B1(2017)]|nr:MAG: hypothetical protein CFE21_01115 [Bacteroidetes bacterium B1(2017)]